MFYIAEGQFLPTHLAARQYVTLMINNQLLEWKAAPFWFLTPLLNGQTTIEIGQVVHLLKGEHIYLSFPKGAEAPFLMDI